MTYTTRDRVVITKFPNSKSVGEIGQVVGVQPAAGSYTLQMENVNLPVVKVYDTEVKPVLDV